MKKPKEFWIKIFQYETVGMGRSEYSDAEVSIDPNCAKKYEDFEKSIHVIEYKAYNNINEALKLAVEALEYFKGSEFNFIADDALAEIRKLMGEK